MEARRTRPSRSPGDEWKQFGGTTLNFISENTAPTSAIAANLDPFTKLTGIDIKITQLELAAMVQKVALDFASGEGAYQIVYADPYQVMAPYNHGARRPQRVPAGPGASPTPSRSTTSSSFQLDASGRFGDREKLFALPYDAPTMIWMYRKDLFEKHGEQMKQDLGFDPNPRDDSTWDDFYKTSEWFKKNADKTGVPYGHGHMAKQHDSLMNDFSNLLWAYGGQYFEDDEKVGSLGSAEPGEPQLTSPEALEGAEMYRKLVSIGASLEPRLGLDRPRRGLHGRRPGDGAAVARVRGRDRDLRHQGQGRLRAPARAAPSARPTCSAARGIGVNGVAPEREQQAAWLFVLWATQKDTQLANLKSKVGGGTPTRDSVYELPEVEKARKPPSKLPNMLPMDAVFEAWKPENVGLRPKIAAWNECDTTIFTQLSKMLAGQQGPEKCMSNTKEGFEKAIENAKKSLQRA